MLELIYPDTFSILIRTMFEFFTFKNKKTFPLYALLA